MTKITGKIRLIKKILNESFLGIVIN
jgi:hypothetical protein